MLSKETLDRIRKRMSFFRQPLGRIWRLLLTALCYIAGKLGFRLDVLTETDCRQTGAFAPAALACVSWGLGEAVTTQRSSQRGPR